MNYKPFAVVEDNSCIIGGCADSASSGYNPRATYDDGSCPVVFAGCTDSTADNYRSVAAENDGSCVYSYVGCMDTVALDHDPTANTPGVCTYRVPGCMDTAANNYFPSANAMEAIIGVNGETIEDGCIRKGCTEARALNFMPYATHYDGSCLPAYDGCTDIVAANYKAFFNRDDGSCRYPGCLQQEFANYNVNAAFDDGTCSNDVSRRSLRAPSTRRRLDTSSACMDPAAKNFDSGVTAHSNQACVYPIYGAMRARAARASKPRM